jgi:hypothetical protein
MPNHHQNYSAESVFAPLRTAERFMDISRGQRPRCGESATSSRSDDGTISDLRTGIQIAQNAHIPTYSDPCGGVRANPKPDLVRQSPDGGGNSKHPNGNPSNPSKMPRVQPSQTMSGRGGGGGPANTAPTPQLSTFLRIRTHSNLCGGRVYTVQLETQNPKPETIMCPVIDAPASVHYRSHKSPGSAGLLRPSAWLRFKREHE